MENLGLPYKVHANGGSNPITGACKYAEDAAIMVGGLGSPAVVKLAGRIVWREGREEYSAGESADRARIVMQARGRDNAHAANRQGVKP